MKHRSPFLSFLLLFFIHLSWCTSLYIRPTAFPEEPFVPRELNITGLSIPCDTQIAEITATDPESIPSMLRVWGRNLGDTGLFYDCTQISNAKYCLSQLDISAENSNGTIRCELNIPQCNIGVCVPSQCNQDDISIILSSIRSKFSLDLNFTSNFQDVSWVSNCQVDTSIAGNPLSWVGIIALSAIVLNVLVATFIHMIVKGTIFSLYQPVDIPKPKKQEKKPKNDQELEFKNVASGPSDLGLIDSIQTGQELTNVTEILLDDIPMEENGDDVGKINETQIEMHRVIKEEIDADAEDPLLGDHEEEEEEEEIDVEETLEGQSSKNQVEALQQVIPKFVQTWAECFSLTHNYQKLLNPIPGDFGSLNALRCFSMLWVILGHTIFFWAPIGFADLNYAYNTFAKQIFFQLVMSGVFAVDSFFFLSGFLGSYFLYERLLDGKRMEWFLIYFHRIWRILPVYTFLMLIYVTMITVLGDGPFWFRLAHLIENTSPNCWSNLLFINNFYPQSSNDQCMGWGWFLAVDMQFFIVTPIIIFIHYKSPKIGWSILVLWLAQDLTTSTALSAVRGYSPNIIKSQPGFFAEFYQRPYTRASPYIVGLSCGYLFSYLRRHRPNFKIPQFVILVGYPLAFSTMCLIVFGIYWDTEWNQFENSLYLGFSRFAWGLSIAFLNMTMFLGYGGIFRKFFFARLWQPLAKLTYGAYLSHPIFMYLFYFNQWQYIMLQNRNFWYDYIGHLVCSFSFAVIAYLLIEKPFMNLEPILIKGVVKLIFKLLRKPLPKDFH